MEFSTRLRDLLHERQMRPIDLARKLGIPPTTVYNWVKGKGEPNPGNRHAICEVLNISEAELFGGVTGGAELSSEQIELIKEYATQLTNEEATKIQRILVVDDDQDACSSIADSIAIWGYETDTAFDGQTALDKIDANHFDLILLDIRMPKMGGVQVLQALRNKGNNTPVVVISGYPEDVTEITIKQLDISGFMLKPCKLSDIQQTIKAIEH